MLDNYILDYDKPILSDNDLFYMMKACQSINGIVYLKILPYGNNDYKYLNANKIKILPLPLKDLNFEEIPLTYKIRQII